MLPRSRPCGDHGCESVHRRRNITVEGDDEEGKTAWAAIVTACYQPYTLGVGVYHEELAIGLKPLSSYTE